MVLLHPPMQEPGFAQGAKSVVCVCRQSVCGLASALACSSGCLADSSSTADPSPNVNNCFARELRSCASCVIFELSTSGKSVNSDAVSHSGASWSSRGFLVDAQLFFGAVIGPWYPRPCQNAGC